MIGGDRIILVPLLEEIKGDTEVDPGMDMSKGGGAHLGTEENVSAKNARDVEENMRAGIVPWIFAKRSAL